MDEVDCGEVAELPRWGRVVETAGVVPWLVVDEDGAPVEAVRRFLRDFVARGNSIGSVRSYAFDLLRWWRWLQAVDVEWDRATSEHVREFVLWFQRASKPREHARTSSAATAGTINPITCKAHLGDGYEPRTVRHSNAVLRSFYEFWIEMGQGPLVNPVPLARRGARPNAHHNFMEPFRSEGRLRYNPKVPKRKPREIPDRQWTSLFAAMHSNRDRAILSLGVGSAARASEVLGLRGLDIDWGEQLVRVVRKGTRAEQWLPAGPEAFIWLRLYLAEIGEAEVTGPIWWTLRRRDRGRGLERQALNYDALRAVFRRANALLGTNWSMHDLRHTAALRMSRDESLSMRDVQTILGHSHLSTTAEVYLVEDEDHVIRRVIGHLESLRERAGAPAAEQASMVGYDAADLATLLGELA
jgi:integrase